MLVNKFVMTDDELLEGVRAGHEQCIVESLGDGFLCWHIGDSREREPIHQVKAGERFWCWNFRSLSGTYLHDYANMAESNVVIHTDVQLRLVFITDDSQHEALFNTSLDKSPNIT
ncbi:MULTISPECIES: hypothetical protein [Vibrio]|uniref:hypothetical protein n=1 Tax=Vibrio TaxID=662 RepID=UPI00084180D3|nr:MULTISPECIES: hypothetical protein [Vibrio]ODM57042.1 hypothetical protein BC455_18290 [Vibrio harveyi]USD58614.1 hypothetical protein J4N44_27055 [Vibrio sp. SCSIO 43155]